jgi:hypothetical protein
VVRAFCLHRARIRPVVSRSRMPPNELIEVVAVPSTGIEVGDDRLRTCPKHRTPPSLVQAIPDTPPAVRPRAANEPSARYAHLSPFVCVRMGATRRRRRLCVSAPQQALCVR